MKNNGSVVPRYFNQRIKVLHHPVGDVGCPKRGNAGLLSRNPFFKASYICVLMTLIIFQSTAFAGPRLRPDTWALEVIDAGLDNFYRLDETVYRSGQPDAKAFVEIEKYGIKEVLNLRQYHSDDDEARKTNLVLHRVKMNAGSVSYPQIHDALQKIKNAKGPILIHCWHGSDRTGVVSAAYRVVFQNWSKAQAVDEMKNGGYGYHHRFYPQLIQMVMDLDVKSFREKLGLKTGD